MNVSLKDILLEKDLRQVLIKKGLTPEMADICHSISPKYAGFVANYLFLTNPTFLRRNEKERQEVIKNRAFEMLIPDVENIIKKLFQENEKPKLPEKPNEMSWTVAQSRLDDLNFILDWINDPTRSDTSDVKKLTWAEAMQKAREYHAEKAERATNTSLSIKSNQKIVCRFDDGYYWLDLQTDYCRDEGDAMGHCGNANDGTLFSLRDRNGVPHITAEINVDESRAYQIYGKGNTKPKEKYHAKILKLLGELDIKRVSKKNYNQESFDVEDDVSDELKQNFENEYKYYPSKGVTDKEIAEAERKINEHQTEYVYGWVSSDEGFNVYKNAYIYFPYFDDDFFEREMEVLKEKLNSELEITDFETTTDHRTDKNVLRVSFKDDGYFDLENEKGSVGYRVYDNLSEWTDKMIDNIEKDDEIVKDILEEWSTELLDFDSYEEEDIRNSISPNFFILNAKKAISEFNEDRDPKNRMIQKSEISFIFSETLLTQISLRLFESFERKDLSNLKNDLKKFFIEEFHKENDSFLYNKEKNVSVVPRYTDQEIDSIVEHLKINMQTKPYNELILSLEFFNTENHSLDISEQRMFYNTFFDKKFVLKCLNYFDSLLFSASKETIKESFSFRNYFLNKKY